MNKFTRVLCLYLIFCSFLLETSNYQELITKEDEPWIRVLIENNFTITPFANVILGSKPMASVLIDKEPNLEELAALELDVSESSNEDRLFFLRLVKLQSIDNEWKKWMVLKTKLPIKNFLFRSNSCFSDEHYIGMIINAREVLWILEKNYDIFSRQLNMQYDPLKVTLEFEDQDSEFWKKVLVNEYLQGILYGFGERNAYFFSLKQDEPGLEKYESGIFLCPEMRYSNGKNPERVDVPAFRSFHTVFGDEDPVVVKFAKEVERINLLLKDSDPYELILKHLMQ